MIKSKELSDPNSYMNRAREDEMTFVLLARDIAAPFMVRCWTQERVRLGKNTWNDPQIKEAWECAAEMERQQKSKATVTLHWAVQPGNTYSSSLCGLKQSKTGDFIRFAIDAPDVTCEQCRKAMFLEPPNKEKQQAPPEPAPSSDPSAFATGFTTENRLDAIEAAIGKILERQSDFMYELDGVRKANLTTAADASSRLKKLEFRVGALEESVAGILRRQDDFVKANPHPLEITSRLQRMENLAEAIRDWSRE